MKSIAPAIIVVKSKTKENIKVRFPKTFGAMVRQLLEDPEPEENPVTSGVNQIDGSICHTPSPVPADE
jgi:hypothetical protein